MAVKANEAVTVTSAKYPPSEKRIGSHGLQWKALTGYIKHGLHEK